MNFSFNKVFSDFIIVSIILFVAYLFHTSFTLSISNNYSSLLCCLSVLGCRYGIILRIKLYYYKQIQKNSNTQIPKQLNWNQIDLPNNW